MPIIRPSFISIFVLGDSEFCKLVDCGKEDADLFCPETCSETPEPYWCRVANCSQPDTVKACNQTCGTHGNTTRECVYIKINYTKNYIITIILFSIFKILFYDFHLFSNIRYGSTISNYYT